MSHKYLKAIEAIENIINNQDTDTMIPSERALSEQLQMSRMTIRKAIDKLVLEGKLYRNANIGTFVADNRLFKVFNKLMSFTEEVLASGSVPSNKVIEFSKEKANDLVASKLSINKGDYVYRVVRLRLRDNDPLHLDFAYFPADIIKLDHKIIQGSIYEHIRNTLKLDIQSSIQTIKATAIPEEYANLLLMKTNEPVILDENIGFLKNGRVFEYALSYRNHHKYELIIQTSVF